MEKEPILSVIVISHEQREELRRCMDSILAMEIPFPYEIIVSDDRSTDGSYELAKDYEEKRINGRLTADYTGINVSNLTRILALQCNSDDVPQGNNSGRSGYNRSHAYPHARGKYLAHVDADDYFRPGARVYEKQVEALEHHPECSLAMSSCLSIDNAQCTMHDGTLKDWREVDLSTGVPYRFPRQMTDGEVIRQVDYFKLDYFHINQCFMQRRNPDVNPAALYGNGYIDSVITLHHLQFGDIVYVEAEDYVYVQYPSSIVGQTVKNGPKDTAILWCFAIYVPTVIPRWTKELYMGYMYQNLLGVVRLARTGYKLSDKSYAGVKDMHLYIYDVFHRSITNWDRARLYFTDCWMRMMKVSGWQDKFTVNVLRNLLYQQW